MREDFYRFLDLEIKRARRYQNFFSIIRFEMLARTKPWTRRQEKHFKSLVNLLREEIRDADVIGQTWDNEVMIILPHCDQSGANVVQMRLSGVIKDFHFGKNDFKVNSDLVCFPVEGTDMPAILEKLSAHHEESLVIGMN
jgi:hypothetical protein